MLRRLFKQSSIYAVASVTSKLTGFILLAYYGDPDVLPKADFGYLGALDAAKMFVLLVAGVGLPLGILRFASSPQLSERERAAVPATALGVALVAGGLTMAAGWGLAPLASEALFGTAARADAIRWLAVFVGFKTVSDVSYTVLRQREKAGAFVLIGVVESLLLVAAVVTGILENGNLIISGSQEVRVNHEIRILNVGGIVRPQDVDAQNMISYERIAEARISYGGRGRLTEVQQPPVGQQVVDLFSPL